MSTLGNAESMLRSSLLYIAALCSSLCYGADTSSTGFYIVLPEASLGSHYFDSDAFPKLGYIADRPDLPISRLESVTLETCGMRSTYHHADGTSEVTDENQQCITIKLYPIEAQVFETLTTLNVGRRMLLSIDEQPISAPNILMPISGGNLSITLSANSDAAGIKLKLDSLVAKP